MASAEASCNDPLRVGLSDAVFGGLRFPLREAPEECADYRQQEAPRRVQDDEHDVEIRSKEAGYRRHDKNHAKDDCDRAQDLCANGVHTPTVDVPSSVNNVLTN